MILAGIDEAGYGPLLGPLVVGCAAFEITASDDDAEDFPDLWKLLRRCVSRTKPRQKHKLHVADSKQVYSPSIGLKPLELATLALAACGGVCVDSLDGLLGDVSPDCVADLIASGFYDGEGDAFPVSIEAVAAKIAANALRAELATAKVRVVRLSARVMPEHTFNHSLNATRNKASTLFSTVAIHLDGLLRDYADQGLTIVCDRQGGRERYGELLRLMFPDWHLEIHREEGGRADYRLVHRDHAERSAKIIFCEKGETFCMPTAVASMLSKYLRESLMARFNKFWLRHVPGLVPTAGYYNDGLRFLRDIEPARATLGIEDARLVRCR